MSIAAAITLSPRRWHGRYFFLALLPLMLLSGCAVSLVAPCDAVTDAAVQEVAQKTETIIADVTQNGTGYAQHRDEVHKLWTTIGFENLKLAAEGVLITGEADVKLAAQDAINAATGVQREAVNASVGLAVL